MRRLAMAVGICVLAGTAAAEVVHARTTISMIEGDYDWDFGGLADGDDDFDNAFRYGFDVLGASEGFWGLDIMAGAGIHGLYMWDEDAGALGRIEVFGVGPRCYFGVAADAGPMRLEALPHIGVFLSQLSQQQIGSDNNSADSDVIWDFGVQANATFVLGLWELGATTGAFYRHAIFDGTGGTDLEFNHFGFELGLMAGVTF